MAHVMVAAFLNPTDEFPRIMLAISDACFHLHGMNLQHTPRETPIREYALFYDVIRSVSGILGA